MTSILACYDYGQGGIWFYVEADDLVEFSQTYPGLMLFPTDPPWWNNEWEQSVRKNDPTKSPFKEILEAARQPNG